MNEYRHTYVDLISNKCRANCNGVKLNYKGLLSAVTQHSLKIIRMKRRDKSKTLINKMPSFGSAIKVTNIHFKVCFG